MADDPGAGEGRRVRRLDPVFWAELSPRSTAFFVPGGKVRIVTGVRVCELTCDEMEELAAAWGRLDREERRGIHY